MNKNKKIIFLLGLMFLLSFIILFDNGLILKNYDYFYKVNINTNSNGNKNKTENKLYKIERIIDGDTVSVKIEGREQSIRMIGLNTPEARDFKQREIECFGKEASQKARDVLEGKFIRIELDDSQSKYDKYGRLLAYVFYQDQNGNWINFNKKMIQDGFGYEYTYHGLKYKYQMEFKKAQSEAEKNKLGLWAPGVCKK